MPPSDSQVAEVSLFSARSIYRQRITTLCTSVCASYWPDGDIPSRWRSLSSTAGRLFPSQRISMPRKDSVRGRIGPVRPKGDSRERGKRKAREEGQAAALYKSTNLLSCSSWRCPGVVRSVVHLRVSLAGAWVWKRTGSYLNSSPFWAILATSGVIRRRGWRLMRVHVGDANARPD
jgi:hypothetical protein